MLYKCRGFEILEKSSEMRQNFWYKFRAFFPHFAFIYECIFLYTKIFCKFFIQLNYYSMKWIEKCVSIKIISQNLLSLEYWDCVSICHHNTRHFRKKFVRRHWRISILKFKMSLAGRTTMAVRRLTTSAIRQDLGHVPPPGHVRLSILFCLSNMSKYWCYNNFF